jgi:hypothetical protein
MAQGHVRAAAGGVSPYLWLKAGGSNSVQKSEEGWDLPESQKSGDVRHVKLHFNAVLINELQPLS